MTRTLVLLAIASACAIGANASPSYPAPPVAGSIAVSESPYALDKAVAHTARIGESPVFFCQAKGGNLALGLLGAMTGVVGVGLSLAINSHNIDAKTAQAAANLSSNQSFDPEPRIREDVIRLAPNLASQASPAFSVAGALLVSSDADDNVRSILVIHATDTSSDHGWSKSYFYHFATVVPRKEFESNGLESLLDKLAPDMAHAIDSTTGVLVDDLSGKLGPGQAMKVRSEFLRPIGNVILDYPALRLADRDGIVVFRVDGKPALMLFPTVDGVHLFQPDQFSTKP